MQTSYLQRILAVIIFIFLSAAGDSLRAQLITNTLALWLSADAGVTIDASGRVSNWEDQSGLGHPAFQPNPSQQPLFVTNAIANNPALRFNGSQFLSLAGQVLTSQRFSIFAVVNDNSTSNGYREIFSNWQPPTGFYSIFFGLSGLGPVRARLTDHFSTAGVGSIQNSADHFIFSGISGVSNVVIYQNENEIASKNQPLPEAMILTSSYVLGRQGTAAAEYWHGDIAELLVYNTELSPSERGQVWKFLKTKYAIGPGTSTWVTLAASDFETNTDGWYGTNNLHGKETVTHQAGGATLDSLGYISVTESQADHAAMYFAAPANYLGDKHAAYNGLLRFSFKQALSTNLTPASKFVLIGSSNAMLSFDLPIVPGTAWQIFDVPLNENVGWHVASSDGLSTSYRLATREDFLAALRSVDLLWIRAEWSAVNFSRSDLDDVELLAQPSGPLQPSLSAATYAGITIEGAVGSSYRIEYRSALNPADSWNKLDDIILSISPYLFIDQSSPSNSVRYYRAALNQ